MSTDFLPSDFSTTPPSFESKAQATGSGVAPTLFPNMSAPMHPSRRPKETRQNQKGNLNRRLSWLVTKTSELGNFTSALTPDGAGAEISLELIGNAMKIGAVARSAIALAPDPSQCVSSKPPRPDRHPEPKPLRTCRDAHRQPLPRGR